MCEYSLRVIFKSVSCTSRADTGEFRELLYVIIISNQINCRTSIKHMLVVVTLELTLETSAL